MSWAIAKWIVKNAGIGKVQRGVTTAAGIVIIAPVNMDKAFVISASKGSAGTVAATGTIAATSITGTRSGVITPEGTHMPVGSVIDSGRNIAGSFSDIFASKP